jgi:outer membrane biosynthesis protein TonB
MSLRSHLRHSSSGRDAALQRLRWINRSIIAGSVALTAIFADTAANTFAGGTTHAKATRVGEASTGAKAAHTTTTSKPLTPPGESPQQAQTPEHEPEPEATPTQEPAPQSSESAPQSSESAPNSEAAPAESTPPPAESTPAPAESTPAPAQEEAPVVSGAS